MEEDEETPKAIPPWVELEYAVRNHLHNQRSFQLRFNSTCVCLQDQMPTSNSQISQNLPPISLPLLSNLPLLRMWRSPNSHVIKREWLISWRHQAFCWKESVYLILKLKKNFYQKMVMVVLSGSYLGYALFIHFGAWTNWVANLPSLYLVGYPGWVNIKW